MQQISLILNLILPIFIGIGIILFLYGLIAMIFTKDIEKRKKRSKIALWSFMVTFIIYIFWFVIHNSGPIFF